MDRVAYWAFAIVVAFGLFFWYMVAHSLYDALREKQRPYTSDGCTFFVEGIWGGCCAAHDRDYWHGGSKEKRALSDEAFSQCIMKETHNRAFALAAYGIVRIGGMPYLATPWRWGYGWSFGREYR